MIEAMVTIILLVLLPLNLVVLHVWLMVIDLHDALVPPSITEDDVLGVDPEVMGG